MVTPAFFLASELAAEKGVPPLLRLFRDGAVSRAEAAAALVALRRRGIDALLSIATDEHSARPELRIAAAAALVRVPLDSPQLEQVRRACIENCQKNRKNNRVLRQFTIVDVFAFVPVCLLTVQALSPILSAHVYNSFSHAHSLSFVFFIFAIHLLYAPSQL